MPLKGLHGKRALVTGAASGIGAAVCERLKREGVQVIATDIHPAPDAIVADLTDSDDVERLSVRAGTPDFIVNVAGGPVAPTREETLPALPKGSLALEDIETAIAARDATGAPWSRTTEVRIVDLDTRATEVNANGSLVESLASAHFDRDLPHVPIISAAPGAEAGIDPLASQVPRPCWGPAIRTLQGKILA